MPRLLLMLGLMCLLANSAHGQSVSTKPGNDVTVLKNSLLFDLQALEADAVKLEKPLALARAKAEIAAAAWTIDEAWAKKLLREAYQLTFPEKEEQDRLRNKPLGTAPTPPTDSDVARSEVRDRVFNIAGRDKSFANELALLGTQQLGRLEEYERYSSLASQAIKAGETETASKYISQAIEAEPTQPIMAVLLDLAVRDRVTADRLVIEFIERLRVTPISMTDRSALRTYFMLQQMVFPGAVLVRERGQILPTGQAAIRAYIKYVIESMSRLSQSEPDSLQVLRGFLLATWLPLNQYAPELTGQFLELEKLSRRPGEKISLPQASDQEAYRVNYEKRIKDALESGQPDDYVFMSAFGRGDFATVRKLLDLLPEGERKARYTEQVNAREALSLAAKGNTIEAERLARQLNLARSILEVYPILIGKCTARKDQACATSLVYQAIKQLKRAGDKTVIPLSLSSLAKTVAVIDETLALEVLDGAVAAANSSNGDTGLGRVGLELDAFRNLAAKNEAQVRQTAAALQDRLQRIVALSAIYQWKAKELIKVSKEQPLKTTG